ncbi:MAG: hypothetical protein QXM43_02445 [Desulfurococcaceae archaeon]
MNNFKELYSLYGYVVYMSVVVATLGFDVTHAVFTIANFKPVEFVALMGLVNGSLDPRSSIAFSYLEQVARASGAIVEKVEVEVLNPHLAVNKIRSVLESKARKFPLVLDLGGGLRLLIVETLIAYFSISSELRRNSRLLLYIEATNKAVEMTSTDLRKMMLKKPTVLSEIEEAVLSAMEEQREYTLDQIYRAIKQRGFSRSKQSIYKTLKKLEKEGFIIKPDRGKYVKITT